MYVYLNMCAGIQILEVATAVREENKKPQCVKL